MLVFQELKGAGCLGTKMRDAGKAGGVLRFGSQGNSVELELALCFIVLSPGIHNS